MATISESQAREQLVQASHMLFQSGVMSHSGHGNMSFRLAESEHMLLTSGGTISNLKPEQLAVVTFDGEVVAGKLRSVTREIVGMHSCVYRARMGVNAVIHTHSPHVTSFALAHKPLPCAYEALLRFGVTEDIPVADWAPRGSSEISCQHCKADRATSNSTSSAFGESWPAGLWSRCALCDHGHRLDGRGSRTHIGGAHAWW